jgi:hypothetical protein
MFSTTKRRATLARCPHRGEAREPMDPRMVFRRRREAFVELFADASPKPKAVNAITRTDPRTKLYDERQRAIIHAGIRDGVISRERIIRYRAQQLLDDFAQYPDEGGSSREQLYVRLMLEQAEAIEAQTVAHALPSEGNRLAAVRETREAIAIAELQCAVLLPSHPISMGASR